jgi:hypothetical protein
MRQLKKETWPYCVMIGRPSSNDMSMTPGRYNHTTDDWCNSCVGKFSKDWYCFVKNIDTLQYAFRKETDAVAFKLKWNYKNEHY